MVFVLLVLPAILGAAKTAAPHVKRLLWAAQQPEQVEVLEVSAAFTPDRVAALKKKGAWDDIVAASDAYDLIQAAKTPGNRG